MTHERRALVDTLVYHQQRASDSSCHCGWGELGHSWAEHVADVYEMVLSERKMQP